MLKYLQFFVCAIEDDIIAYQEFQTYDHLKIAAVAQVHFQQKNIVKSTFVKL
jgi:hypothetical protein